MIAVGLLPGSIIILNAITGIQVTTLSGHTRWVESLVFSPDGTTLVSGSADTTIKLWDMQTGGVVKTFQFHTGRVLSVSLSTDCTIIASGSDDETIRLWGVQTGECYCIIKQEVMVDYVCFSPLDSKQLISASGGKIWQWDISGQKIVPLYDGSYIAFSLDGTQLVMCNGSAIEVQSSDSKRIMAKFHMANKKLGCCCFSPDNRVIAAAAAGGTIYIWNITNSDHHLLETFIGHTEDITSLAFSSPSSLISVSFDKSVKFWQIGASSTDPVLADTALTSAPIKSITLQAKDGIAISSHSDGMVRVWDIPTGLCKASFQTPAKDPYQIDTLLTNSRLISVWCTDEGLCVWNTEQGELIRTVDMSWTYHNGVNIKGLVADLRISGDGFQVFCLYQDVIQACSIQTGEAVGEVGHKSYLPRNPLLTIDGQRVWARFLSLSVSIKGWDFGVSGSSPVELSNMSQNGPHLDFIGGIRMLRSLLPGIQDTVSGKVVFQLPVRLARCSDAQWDGKYLVAGYDSGDVLILECNCVDY